MIENNGKKLRIFEFGKKEKSDELLVNYDILMPGFNFLSQGSGDLYPKLLT